MDKVDSKTRSYIMSRVKSKNTELEKSVRKALTARKVRYRISNGKHFGKPDLLFMGKKTAVFIDSCFWHGCSEHCRLPVANGEYWKTKIERSMVRDQLVDEYYREKGWTVIRIWGHDLKKQKSIEEKADEIVSIIYRGKDRMS